MVATRPLNEYTNGNGAAYQPQSPIVSSGEFCCVKETANVVSEKELRDRRRHKRHLPKEWVSAHGQTSIVGIARLLDISKGGAAFQYVRGPGVKLATLKKTLILHLFETVTSQGVKDIECKVVYDTEVPREDNSQGDHRLRRCGVQFGNHNWYQSSQLDLFIRDFTLEGN